MQAAFSSVKLGLNSKPRAVKNAIDFFRSRTARLTKIFRVRTSAMIPPLRERQSLLTDVTFFTERLRVLSQAARENAVQFAWKFRAVALFMAARRSGSAMDAHAEGPLESGRA